MREQGTLFDMGEPEPIGHHGYPIAKPAKQLARPSHPETSQRAAVQTEKNLSLAIIFALGWVEESLREPSINDVTSYEVDQLAESEFLANLDRQLPERCCGKRFGDLKDLDLVEVAGTRISQHSNKKLGQGEVECYVLTAKGVAQINEHEKWWLQQTPSQYRKNK